MVKSVGYYVNWATYKRNYQPSDIPASYLTHIFYAFADINKDTGEVSLSDPWADIQKKFPNDPEGDDPNNLYGCIKQLYLLKKHHRSLKLILSIGGATFSPNFANPASTPEGRTSFASSAVQLVKDLGLDGLEIDWEDVADADQARHYVELLKETRSQLDDYGTTRQYKFLLTVAAPCGAQNYEKLKITEMDRYLDFWNLMAYDFSGKWSTNAAHQASLYRDPSNPDSTYAASVDEAVKAYVLKEVEPKKLVLGMPLYGRSFENTDGPGKQYSGNGEGSWENGVWDYKVLQKPGATEINLPKIGASYSYDYISRELVSYDTPVISKIKAKYILDNHLGGGMWWEFSGDPSPTGSQKHRALVKTLVNTWQEASSSLDSDSNMLEYPDSKYRNLREGMPRE